MKKIAVIPTLCTLAGGACGFMSVLAASKVPLDDATTQQMGSMALAGWLIFAAMFFDMLDGHLARLSKSATEFGGQLDSLCDVISFGVAPAFLFLRLCDDIPHGRMTMISVLYVVCVVLRLARYNVETTDDPRDHLQFSGLPSPAAGGTLAAMGILLDQLAKGHLDVPGLEIVFQKVVPIGAVVLALLMVSRIPYPHLMNQILQGHHRFAHIVKLIFAGITILFIPELSLPVIFSAFVIGAPLRFLWEEVVLRRPREEPLF